MCGLDQGVIFEGAKVERSLLERSVGWDLFVTKILPKGVRKMRVQPQGKRRTRCTNMSLKFYKGVCCFL